MRTVNPANMATARRLGARRLHYTAVSAAIRDTGRPGGGDWSVIYNCAVPSRYPFVGGTDARTAPLVFLGRLDRIKGAHHAIAVARRLQRRLVIAGNISPYAHEQEYFEREIKPQIDGTLVTVHRPGRRCAETRAARRRGGDADADRMGGAVSGRAARGDAVRHAAHRVPARRSARRHRSRPHRFPVRHGRRDGGARRPLAGDRSRHGPRRSGAPLQRHRGGRRVRNVCTSVCPIASHAQRGPPPDRQAADRTPAVCASARDAVDVRSAAVRGERVAGEGTEPRAARPPRGVGARCGRCAGRW